MKTIDHNGIKYCLASWFKSPTGAEKVQFSDKTQARQFLQIAMRGGLNKPAMRSIIRSECRGSDVYHLNNRQIVEKLSHMLLTGRIRLYKTDSRKAVLGGGAGPTGQLKDRRNTDDARPRKASQGDQTTMVDIFPTPKIAPAPAQTTWIEIELIGEDDLPIPFAKYVIAGPDKTIVKKGRLDRYGLARKEQLKPGKYTVNFPDLDKDAWEPVN